MIIGYARVSTKDQDLEKQISYLRESGCDKIYEEVISGARTKDSKLENIVIPHLRSGDTLVVTKFDRLGRSTNHLFNLVNRLKEAGIKLKSLHDNIDTETQMGKFFLMVMSFMAEWEREWIGDRIRKALKVVKDKQGYLGRPKGSVNPQTEKNATLAYYMRYHERMPLKDIENYFGIARSTLHGWLWKQKKKKEQELGKETV